MRRIHPNIRSGLLGLAEGGLVSIMPLEWNLYLIIIIVVIWWPVLLIRAVTSGERIGRHFIRIGVAIGTVIAAIFLPVKYLDGRVGPMHYENVSIHDLRRRLHEDWDLSVIVYTSEITNMFVTFNIEKRMSRRRLLEKLAHDMNMDLKIGYCGNGASFLFGADPLGIRLTPREARQDAPTDMERPGLSRSP